MSKAQVRTHIRRGTSNQTFCGRRVVPGDLVRYQEVRRDRIAATWAAATCKACLHHSGLERREGPSV